MRNLRLGQSAVDLRLRRHGTDVSLEVVHNEGEIKSGRSLFVMHYMIASASNIIDVEIVGALASSSIDFGGNRVDALTVDVEGT